MNPNLAAFLKVIRRCEGTAGPNGYRTMFGGVLFESLDDHPRSANTYMLGGKPITSTAAGAYQFLSSTWDEVRAMPPALPDFGRASQDEGAIRLIKRRGAYDDVIAGRLDQAIARCAKEWASLPGSPYGQPVKTLEQCRKYYVEAGGQFSSAPPENPETPASTLPPPDGWPTEQPAAAPDIAGPNLPPPDDWPSHDGTFPETRPMAPLVPIAIAAAKAALPILTDIAPVLARIFGSGSEVAERNARAVEAVAEAAKRAAQSDTIEGAVSKIQADAATAAAFREQINLQFSQLMTMADFEEKSRHQAREFAERMTSGDGWRAFGFGAVMAVLALIIIIGVGAMIWMILQDPSTSAEQRGMLIGAMITAAMAVISYFFGSSASSRSKDTALSDAVRSQPRAKS